MTFQNECEIDNEPQYILAEFAEFASSYGFKHTTSSQKSPFPSEQWMCEENNTDREEDVVKMQRPISSSVLLQVNTTLS